MATDSEKLAMLDRAFALDVARKIALEVTKHLTTLEVRDLTPGQEEAVRGKLSAARSAWSSASVIVAQLLREPVDHGRSEAGPLFDEVAGALKKAGILAEARG
jgi:hypothetical protein